MIKKETLISLALVSVMIPAAESAVNKVPVSFHGSERQLLDKTIASNIYKAIPQPRITGSQRLASGLVEYTLSDAEGFLTKSYSDPSKSLRITPLAVQRPQAADAGTINESFEDYDGTSRDWIPSDWSEQTAIGYNGTGSNCTWHVSGATSDFRPTNGQYQAIIQYSDRAQDEWLISPEFTAVSGTRFYADITCSLFSIYDPEYFDAEKYTFTKRKLTATMAIKIWHDGVWEEVWNARDAASRLSDRELFEQYISPTVQTARISLDAYAGKQIKIAFEYYGTNGNSMAVDFISVATPNNMAVYHRPRGFFFEGMNEEYAADEDFAAIVGPAYSDSRWNVLYTRDVQSVEWEFADFNNLEKNISIKGWAPTMNYPYCITYAPSVTAKSNGLAPLTYQYDIANKATGIVKYGGTGCNMEDNSIIYGCGSYNWRCGFQGPLYSDKVGSFLFGPSSNPDFWETAGMHLTSVASYYEKPVEPYIFDKFWIHANELDADADAEFTLNIYRINDVGYLEPTPYATSVIKVSDILKYQASSGYLYALVFPFEQIKMESAMMVELTGYMDNEKIRAFSPLTQNNPHVDAETNGYIFYTRAGRTYIVNTSSILSNFYCPFIFTMNATYPFFISDSYEWEAPLEGGGHSFEINSYYLTSSWTISEDIPEWINDIETVEETDADGYTHMALRIGVDPLTDGSGRIWEFTISVPGVSRTFRITQGSTAGISEMNSENKEITGIYDLGGRYLGTSAEGLAGGIYLIKTSDGKIQKIAKQ